ncbi:MAG TPA: DUF1080 domain-containing protein [Planctomycetota bacterium]|jgi:hypothetical protein
MKRVHLSVAVFLLAFGALAADAVTPFNGKDLTGWRLRGPEAKSGWKVGKASLDTANAEHLVCTDGGNEMVNVVEGHGKGVDIYTEEKWGDVHLELELMVAKGSNSGVYLMGEYEIQVLDSFGKQNPGPGDMGAIYNQSAPKVNACKAPGEWQKLVVDFVAPKFDADGKKTADAKFVKIVLNDQVIQENFDSPKPTGGELGKESPTGPLLFQGNHGPVAFRNIKITPSK